jgi:CCR4-NOT transcription complex subunit 9
MSDLHENINIAKKIFTKGKSKTLTNEEELIIKLFKDLKDEEKRTKALSKLSEFYDKNPNLPIYLWYSQGTMTILLQEIISSYKYLSSMKLTQEKSSKIYSILRLLTCIASHKEIRYKFIESKMPIFLYPFLNSTSTAKQNEYIKLLTLTVIGSLIKIEDPKIISFFINTEIVPILLKIIDTGPWLSKIPACIMIHLIIKDDEGLKYICGEKVRYSAIICYMKRMIKMKHNQKILDFILKTFLRLAENNEARIILKNNLLKDIKDKNFTKHLRETSKLLNNNLIKILNEKDDINSINNNNKIKENNIKDGNKINNSNNINIKNNNEMINNQYNLNNNNNSNKIMMVNQMNQMKLGQNYMIQNNNNFGDINNNFIIYNNTNTNDNYLNKINFIGNNQNNNKQYGNMNLYNIYKSS